MNPFSGARATQPWDCLWQSARQWIIRTPYVWDGIYFARGSRRFRMARRGTGIVFEGFPRSGNTYSWAAFETANGKALHVGHHTHHAAHVLRAVRLGIPTVVLIRDPSDAVLSYLIMRPTLTAQKVLDEYAQLYEALWPVRSRFITAPFDRVVSDFGSVIDDVNTRFGTRFTRYDNTPKNEAAVAARVEQHNRRVSKGVLRETHIARPSGDRKRRKAELVGLLQEKDAAASLVRATELYERYMSIPARGVEWEGRA